MAICRTVALLCGRRTWRTVGTHHRRYCSSSSGKIVFSGIQPTGELHLGNYFGAIEKWVQLQSDPSVEKMYISVVDLHAITVPTDLGGDRMKDRVYAVTAGLLASGLDPKRCVLFQQSHIPHHCELTWILGCLSATMAQLGRLAQYKERSAKYKDGNVPLGLFVYPVLQAADILLYRATHVPVGADQQQHLYIAKDFAEGFNFRIGKNIFPLPECISSEFTRVKSLRDPKKKMSKSDTDEKSRVNLSDESDVIKEKFKKAMTDMTSRVTYDPENRAAVANLIHIHSIVTGLTHDQICSEAKDLTTAQYKLKVADCVIEKFRTVREDYKRYMNDRSYLDAVLKEGAAKAEVEATKTLKEVRELVGFD